MFLATETAVAREFRIKCPPDAKWFYGWRFYFDDARKVVIEAESDLRTNVVVKRWDSEVIEFTGLANYYRHRIKFYRKEMLLEVSGRSTQRFSSFYGKHKCKIVDKFDRRAFE